MDNDSIQNLLRTTLQKSGKTSPSYPKRMLNIEWANNLSRMGLAYRIKEKQILIKSISSTEEIYLQYPGKEMVESLKNKVPWSRPLDFRPKLYYKTQKTYHDDIAFGALWEDLENSFAVVNDKKTFRMLATVFYRMAFMVDHILMPKEKLKVNLLEEEGVVKESIEEFEPRYAYNPDNRIIAIISKAIPTICDMRLQSFLHYMDLLTWNEDCKYYYGKNGIVTKADQATIWLNATGRVNTLLTMVHFLGLLLGEIKHSHLFAKFAKFGVAGARGQDVLKICNGFIS